MLRHLVMAKGLDVELFNRTTELLAKAFRVDASRQRIDSVHIRSNMKRLGRLGISSSRLSPGSSSRWPKRPLGKAATASPVSSETTRPTERPGLH